MHSSVHNCLKAMALLKAVCLRFHSLYGRTHTKCGSPPAQHEPMQQQRGPLKEACHLKMQCADAGAARRACATRTACSRRCCGSAWPRCPPCRLAPPLSPRPRWAGRPLAWRQVRTASLSGLLASGWCQGAVSMRRVG
jgi:hypothetical protein